MSSSMSEIRGRITSDDVDVLRQSLAVASACLADERDRSKTAETRAAAMLAVLGVIAGLVVPQATTLGPLNNGTGWFLFVAYISPLLFLLKGLIYAVRVLSVSMRFRNTPERLFSFQDGSEQEALRLEIAAAIWEYRQSVQPTTAKLYWLDRCQRSGLTAVIFLAVFATAVIVARQQWFEIPLCVTLVFGLLVAVMFAGESLVARRGIWKRGA